MLAAALATATGRSASARRPDLLLLVELSEDRDRTGTLALREASGRLVAGPFAASGRADDRWAARHGNPGRDPAKPYGDVPAGEYEVARVVPTGNATGHKAGTYGPNGALALRPVGGQAKVAEGNGRAGLLVHGGPPGPDGRLRPTHGCIRLADRDVAALVAAVAVAGRNARSIRCELVRLAATADLADGPPRPSGSGDPSSGVNGTS